MFGELDATLKNKDQLVPEYVRNYFIATYLKNLKQVSLEKIKVKLQLLEEQEDLDLNNLSSLQLHH